MAKFRMKLSFVAVVDIDAQDEHEAFLRAEDIIDAHSVYADDELDVMHDEAYCAGGTGGDPPLKKRRAYTMRNADFEPQEPLLVVRAEQENGGVEA